jgi:hypothetical protein
MRKLALPVLVFFVSAAALLAQNYRGRIEGLVTDQSGAVIVDATVTPTDVGTGISQVRQSGGTGMYLFDLLDPGTYSVKVEFKGFREFIQENVILQASNDITVNAVLQPGAVQQTIEVTATPSQVQFTTSNQDITLNSNLASETPRYDRNPFKLTLLAPEAINTRTEILPFLSWSANSVDLGGGTNLKNELEVDGSPVGLGHKYSYPPNMDAVEAVNVAQNSTDAEFGHSAGGVITTTTKSGTNEWHGSAYFLGRYPWANAIYDRITMSTSSTSQNMGGGTIGGPIRKNKLFNFGSFEYWKVGNPTSFVYTVSTALEQTGDFSKSYNVDGSLKAVYDPYSTVFNSSTGAYTRTQFTCNGMLNVICPGRMDPVSVAKMAMMWAPNNPGANITGVNNSQFYSIDAWNYYNWSDRVDYNITDKWKIFSRVSGYHTPDIYSNWTPNKSQLYVPTGTVRTSKQFAGDAVWTVTSNTILDFHGSYQRLVDAYDSTPMPSPGWASVWPKNPWYVPLLQSSSNVPVYFPDFTIGGQNFGGRGFYWDQRPLGEDFSAKYSHQFRSGFLKAGFQMHHAYGPVYVSNTSIFHFDTANTANTPVNPNLLYSGDQWGSFLLGSLNNDTEVIAGPAPNPHTTLYGFWAQYDWRVNRRVTLNLGLRDEYEKAWSDPNRTLSRGLDLTAPVPEMIANPPIMPAQAINLVGSNFWKYNGEWQWMDNSHPGMWNAPTLKPPCAPATPASSFPRSSTSLPLRWPASRTLTSLSRPSSA